MSLKPAYTYHALVIDCFDGDTITAIVDIGFSITITEKFRLYGINTPELMKGNNREAGKSAKDFLHGLIYGKEVVIKTYKTKEKYGRFLAEIEIDGVNVNKTMIDSGHAAPYMVDNA